MTNKSKRARRTSQTKDNYKTLNIESLEPQRPQMKRQWPLLKKKTKRLLAEEAEIQRAQAMQTVDFYDE